MEGSLAKNDPFLFVFILERSHRNKSSKTHPIMQHLTEQNQRRHRQWAILVTIMLHLALLLGLSLDFKPQPTPTAKPLPTKSSPAAMARP
jgi:hypothetical protein